VLFSRYCLHLPLNRQSAVDARDGIEIDVSTADRVGACAATLMPLIEAILAHVSAAERIRADDTTVLVLVKGETRTGRLWTYATAGPLAGQIHRGRRSSTRPIAAASIRSTVSHAMPT
jgi:transposase